MSVRTQIPHWQRKDLCTACQSVDLDQICSEDRGEKPDVALRISTTSTCVLCCFFTSVLHLQDTPGELEGEVIIGLSHWNIRGIDHICISNHYEAEYITQITDTRLLREPETIGQYRHIDPSCVDYHMMRDWVAHCRSTHGKPCQMLTTKPIHIPKFRLLDCDTEAIAECTDFADYVALSYVWGYPSIHKEKHIHVLSSPVIRDAMKMTLELGFRYLWVDQLCINQTSAKDMTCQLSQMHTICMVSLPWRM